MHRSLHILANFYFATEHVRSFLPRDNPAAACCHAPEGADANDDLLRRTLFKEPVAHLDQLSKVCVRMGTRAGLGLLLLQKVTYRTHVTTCTHVYVSHRCTDSANHLRADQRH